MEHVFVCKRNVACVRFYINPNVMSFCLMILKWSCMTLTLCKSISIDGDSNRNLKPRYSVYPKVTCDKKVIHIHPAWPAAIAVGCSCGSYRNLLSRVTCFFLGAATETYSHELLVFFWGEEGENGKCSSTDRYYCFIKGFIIFTGFTVS
jgi:hypothetical protein